MYDAETGIWEPDNRTDEAGLYAVVVGVSEYPYLQDGSKCINDPYRFGQLVSSAYTASRVFDWLIHRYQFQGCPARKVWLLLAPGENERGNIGLNAPNPTLQNLSSALTAWHNELLAMPAAIATRSRALFFFSGHGLERDMDQQLLLPSDFWSNGSVNWAINSKNLQEGLASSHVPWQLFLIDACRNDPFLKQQFGNVRGMEVLSVVAGQTFYRTAPIVYGSASGQSAWQADDPSRPTVFGEALLAGLEVTGRPPIEPDCSSQPCVINFAPLYSYINTRVSDSLARLRVSEADPDPIVVGGITRGKTPICHVQEPHARKVERDAGAPPTRQLSRALAAGAENVRDWIQSPAVRDLVSRVPVHSALVAAAQAGLGDYLAALAPTEQERSASYKTLFQEGNDLTERAFGTSAVARFFMESRLYEWREKRWETSRSRPRILRVERASEQALYRITFEFQNATRWHWMECPDLNARFAFFFPGMKLDQDEAWKRQIFEMEIGLSQIDEIRFARPSLALSNEGLIGEAAILWHKYRVGSAESATQALARYASGKYYIEPFGPDQTIDDNQVNQALDLLFAKYSSPLAATIGALIVTRAGAYDAMTYWLDNLIEINYGSDAAIFAIKRALATGRTTKIGSYFTAIARNGMPFTSEATSYLMQILEDAKASNALDKYEAELRWLEERLDDLYPGFRTGGLFTSFVSPTFMLDEQRGLSGIRGQYK